MSFSNLLYDPLCAWRKYVSIPLLKHKFHFCGKNVFIGKNFIAEGPENISISENVCIGPNCVFYASLAPLIIGKYCLISPGVTIMTGDHRYDLLGEYMFNVKESLKKKDNDKPVIIEDDVWIGSNVTILKGVKIGRGSIIHAGSIISRSIKPYTLYVNNEIKINRFSDEQIQEHERILKEKYSAVYPEYHPKSNSFLS